MRWRGAAQGQRCERAGVDGRAERHGSEGIRGRRQEGRVVACVTDVLVPDVSETHSAPREQSLFEKAHFIRYRPVLRSIGANFRYLKVEYLIHV